MNRSLAITYPAGGPVDVRDTPATLGPRLLDYSLRVSELMTPDDVLDGLHAVTSAAFDLRVLGAFRVPRKVMDWDSMRLGRTAFLHKDAPDGWWEEWWAFAQNNNPIGYMMMRASIAPFTWTEGLQMLQPIGIDRSGYELGLKYQLRDGLTCPVGARWLVIFWSRKVLSKTLSQAARIMIFGASSFAAMRLEQLVGTRIDASGEIPPSLTPRELAVLRLAALGNPDREIAKELALGDETVRTHMKKAQTKLGARNRTHAVAEAMRQYLIA
jgi:LuxR family transcriptional regulator, quorum-sensing system regulator BjaR1